MDFKKIFGIELGRQFEEIINSSEMLNTQIEELSDKLEAFKKSVKIAVELQDLEDFGSIHKFWYREVKKK